MAKYKVTITDPCPHCSEPVQLVITRTMAKHLFKGFKEHTKQAAQAYIRRHVKGINFVKGGVPVE